MDVQGQSAVAERALKELQEAVQDTASSKGKKKTKLDVPSCEKLAQRVKTAVESYRLEIRSLPKEEQVQHQERLRTIEVSLRQCRERLEWKRMDQEKAAAAQAASSSGGGAGLGLEAAGEGSGPMSLEQATAVADKIQDQSHASVKRSMQMVLQAEQVGIATLVKMHHQDEQMNRISEDVEDIKANIKRSKKLLAQIARGAANDRCIQMLCLMITIAVMVCVVMGITGNDGGSLALPDQARDIGEEEGE